MSAMTNARRLIIFRHLTTITSLDELEAFRAGLRDNGELADSEVIRAIRNRQDALQAVRVPRR